MKRWGECIVKIQRKIMLCCQQSMNLVALESGIVNKARSSMIHPGARCHVSCRMEGLMHELMHEMMNGRFA